MGKWEFGDRVRFDLGPPHPGLAGTIIEAWEGDDSLAMYYTVQFDNAFIGGHDCGGVTHPYTGLWFSDRPGDDTDQAGLGSDDFDYPAVFLVSIDDIG